MKKIVIKVQMNCEKCKGKVMKIAATTPGVISVSLVGEISDGKITVTGDGVDSVTLTSTLRKKLGSASIESIEEVKVEEKAAEKKEEVKANNVEYYPYEYYPPYPQTHYFVPVDVAYPKNTCTIM